MRSCRTRKRAVYLYLPGGVRPSHATALHVQPAAVAAAAAATAATAAAVAAAAADAGQFTDY